VTCEALSQTIILKAFSLNYHKQEEQMFDENKVCFHIK